LSVLKKLSKKILVYFCGLLLSVGVAYFAYNILTYSVIKAASDWQAGFTKTTTAAQNTQKQNSLSPDQQQAKEIASKFLTTSFTYDYNSVTFKDILQFLTPNYSPTLEKELSKDIAKIKKEKEIQTISAIEFTQISTPIKIKLDESMISIAFKFKGTGTRAGNVFSTNYQGSLLLYKNSNQTWLIGGFSAYRLQ
jgi:hypothetical protein